MCSGVGGRGELNRERLNYLNFCINAMKKEHDQFKVVQLAKPTFTNYLSLRIFQTPSLITYFLVKYEPFTHSLIYSSSSTLHQLVFWL